LTVLQVLPALEGGGVERGTLELGKFLVDQGHRSLVMSAGGRMVAQLENEGSQHFAWPVGRKSLRTLCLVRKLRRFMIEQRVDILHVRSRLPGWVGYLAWRGMDRFRRPRLVTTVHGFYSPGFYSSVMMRGERVIAVSGSIADYILGHYRCVDAAAISVIPRGIDPARYFPGHAPDAAWRQCWQDQFPHLAGKRLVVLAGRITRLKGHHDFIRLISQLKTSSAGVHGLIVGEADSGHRSYLEELHAEVARLGLQNDITFVGHRNDLREIFSASALVLSLSTQAEAFGRTVLEALALGVPVVAYGHGGVGEVLDAMFPQGRVEANDLESVRRACERCLAGNERPGALPDRFRLEEMVQGTLQVYQGLFATGRTLTTVEESCCGR
jgi:glycosyltransferase involved in cell wall biosynthesis